MSEQQHTHTKDELPAYRPRSGLSALLFLSLPYLHPSVRPLAELAFHLQELTRLLNEKNALKIQMPLFSSSVVTDKDGLLSALRSNADTTYRPMFETIATMLQMMQFYKMYQEVAPLLQGLNPGGDAASMLSGMSSLFGGQTDMLSGLFGGLTSAQTPKKEQETPPLKKTEAAPEPEAATEPVSEPVLEAAPPSKDDEQNPYSDLLSLLTPEQQELYKQISGLF